MSSQNPKPPAQLPDPVLSGGSLSWTGLATAAGFVVCIFTVTGFAGRWGWLFEITSHFRVQYAVILAVIALGLLACGRRRAVFPFLAFAALNGWLLLPFLSGTTVGAATKGVGVRLLAWNVNSNSSRFDELERLVREQNPDLVLLLEVSPAWEEFLERSFDQFPHRSISARDDNFGIALLAREPLLNVRTEYLGIAGLPSISGQLTLGGRNVDFLATHPLPPVGGLRTALRDDQLERMAEWVTHRTNQVVVVGDLNITPWSPTFQDFLRTTGLKNSGEGRGLGGTWPAFFPPMLIPIDHFLHTEAVLVRDRRIIKAAGSDHLPQRIEFGIGNP